MDILFIGCVGVVFASVAFFIWRRRVVTVTDLAKLNSLKEGTKVKVIGKLRAKNEPLSGNIVAHVLEQFRGSSGWLPVRKRQVPLEIVLRDGTVQVTSDNYAVSAREPAWFSKSTQSSRDADGHEVASQEIEGPKGKYVATWNSEHGSGTLRRVALKVEDAVAVFGTVVVAAGSSRAVAATSLETGTVWEWEKESNTVPIANMMELRALPKETSVVFYATVSAANPTVVESFVLANEEEFSVSASSEPVWEVVNHLHKRLTVEIPGGSVRLLDSDYSFSMNTKTVFMGLVSQQMESKESAAGIDYRFILDQNGQIETAEFDAATKRGTRRYRGIEAGDRILIVGNVQNGAEGVSVAPKQISAYREGMGLFKTKSGAPSDDEKVSDLMED